MIRNLPPLYDSQPNDPSMRRVGSYLMWVAIAATCVTSSMFLTALAPNLLAVELVRKTAKIEITWLDWFMYFAPVGIFLLAVLPLQFGVEVGVHLVDDGGELVDELPHGERGLSSFQDEEDRSQVAFDVPVAGVGDVGLDLGVQRAVQHMLSDG